MCVVWFAGNVLHLQGQMGSKRLAGGTLCFDKLMGCESWGRGWKTIHMLRLQQDY